MRKYFTPIIAVFLSVSISQKAYALNLGFVRFPDWMDFYVVLLFGITAIAWLGLWATKPKDVPFKQLPNVQISPVANFFRYTTVAAFLGGMGMVFLGMGLIRFAEATN